jgi:hypothetical protein
MSGQSMLGTGRSGKRIFHLFLIKPSHYDDDGYVIQWLRSAILSNTLAALNGLVLDCIERRVLGDDIDIVVTAIDETNTRVRARKIVQTIRKAGGCGPVGLVGVQSNQFPHAVDLARPLRKAGVQVCIGGSTCPAAGPCCPSCHPTSARPWIWASRSSSAKPRADWTRC